MKIFAYLIAMLAGLQLAHHMLVVRIINHNTLAEPLDAIAMLAFAGVIALLDKK